MEVNVRNPAHTARRKHKVDITIVVELAMEAWAAMFPTNAAGRPAPHEGLINAFRSVGIMPYNPDALPDDAFMPAEMAGKAVEAARVKAGIVKLTAEQVSAIVEEALPFVPAVPVDIEAAKAAVRKRSTHVPELLTSNDVRVREAKKILEKEATEAAKTQQRAATAV